MFEIFNYVLIGSSSSKPRRKEEDNFEIVTKPDDQPDGKFNRFDVLSETDDEFVV